ncbi:MAG: response regulator [Sphingobacteriaceae bacterium]|nr:response regulator [Sphingobacteriaceae bacterium]
MNTSKSKTILCIDDDSINILVLKHLVHAMGYNTASASSGEEGLAMLKNKAIDLVLLDIYMPHMDGFETAAAIRELHVGMPIVFISAGEVEQLAEKMKKLDIQYFLAKPVNKELLQEVLDTIL